MDIRHFITFKKVAELGNFTRASEALGYSQSSVTAHIQSLEYSIGAPLFDRLGKKIELTNRGVKLLKHVNELLEVYERIELLAHDEDEPQGVLRIGVPETLILYRLESIFKSYKSRYPKVNLVFENTPSSKLIEGLHKGELDLAFVLDSKIKDPDLEAHTLIKEEMCFIFPPGSPSPSINNIADGLSIFLTEKGCSYRHIFEGHLKENSVSDDNMMETWSIETIKKCVINGIGMSFLPFVAVAEEDELGKIIALPCDCGEDAMFSQIAYHRKKWQSPAFKAFLSLTLEDSKNWQNFSPSMP